MAIASKITKLIVSNMLSRPNPFAKAFNNATLFVDKAIANVASLAASKTPSRKVLFLFPSSFYFSFNTRKPFSTEL
jgi:hypothetical protein